MTITILPEEIINQIAAGEVIENPSAVIKELVENAIDAKATKIDILLEDSGFKTIIIKDNGVGMSKEDLSKAPIRHATSKISSFEDLYSITTMGFRGEALASIFSVAKTTIETSQDGNSGFRIDNEFKVTPFTCDKGTKIIVRDLFYNTPARKKYLKSKTLEFKAIVEVFSRFTIAYPNIAFTLQHDGNIIQTKPSFSTLKENLIYIFGKEIKQGLLPFEKEMNGLKISGFIGNPSEITYSYKKHQYFFVNKRFIKSKLLTDAVYSGFGSNLMQHRHPFFCLFLEIDPEIIDVNVHPTKIEVRFENEQEIYSFVKESIEKIFQEHSLFKDFEEKEQQYTLQETTELEITKSLKPQKEKTYFTPETQHSFEIKDQEIVYEKPNQSNPLSSDLPESESPCSETHSSSSESESIELGPLYYELSEYKILGQLDKTYIVLQTKTDMILVDQHVAEEKYYYEQFKYSKQTIPKQQLLQPVLLHLDLQDKCLYDENKEVLETIGFETEEYGTNEIMVRTIPLLFRHKENNAENLKELLHDIVVNKSIKCVDEEHHSKIASMACRMAVMAGDELTYPQMKKMIENLRYLKQPFNCPHGRPTFLKYSLKDLEKKFKRVL
jgi:DNA mismatch repair protein MutL